MKNLKKLLVFFFICLLILAVYQGQGLQNKNPKTVPISITVDEEGNIRCDRAEARRGNWVQWDSEYTFAIDFSKTTPFRKFKFQSRQNRVRAQVIFRGAEETGTTWTFKYFVAVYYEGKVLTLDPDLDIRP